MNTSCSTILVVDDDPNFRLIARKVLSKAGFHVKHAEDGQQGLDSARSLLPAVILLDWMMPVLDGPEVCRRLKKDSQLQNSQIIMVSARGELEDKVSGLDSGADDYLVKPCEPKELLARVRSAQRVFELKRQLAEKANRQALLRRAADQIRSSLDIGEILRSTAEEVRLVMNASQAVIFQVDPVTQQVIIRTEATVSGIPSVSKIALEGEKALFPLQVLKSGRSVQIPDILEPSNNHSLSNWIASSELRSVVAVPIIVGQTTENSLFPTYGLALHQCGAPRHWTDEEITFLESLATQTGIALEHARLYEQARQQARREALLNRTTDRIRRSLNLEEVFQATVDELRELLAASRCVIFELDEQEEFIITRCESAGEKILSVRQVQLPIDTSPLACQVIKEGKTVCIEKISSTTSPAAHVIGDGGSVLMDRESLQELMPLALLALPLRARGKVVAGLALHQCDRPRRWLPEEVELVTAIANQTGLAIENAQLFQEIQAQNQLLQETVSKLEELARQREEFTAVLVHDIRSPLTVVTGALEILEQKAWHLGLLNADMRELIENGQTTVNNIVKLVTEILDFSKAEAGGLHLNLAPINLNDLIEATQQQVKLLAQQKHIFLHSVIESNLPEFQADTAKISRALTNLLSNAIKFTPQDGEVCIEVRKMEGTNVDTGKQFIKISVIDNGPGIPSKDLPYLFNPYYQARQKTRQLGTGLGLAIVQRIAAAHGGNVSVQSTEGVGTAFSLILPAIL